MFGTVDRDVLHVVLWTVVCSLQCLSPEVRVSESTLLDVSACEMLGVVIIALCLPLCCSQPQVSVNITLNEFGECLLGY